MVSHGDTKMAKHARTAAPVSETGFECFFSVSLCLRESRLTSRCDLAECILFSLFAYLCG